jgi:hypothetical protein
VICLAALAARLERSRSAHTSGAPTNNRPPDG